jgi:hypothetical protein
MKARHVALLVLMWFVAYGCYLLGEARQQRWTREHMAAAVVIVDNLSYDRYTDLVARLEAPHGKNTWPPLPQRALTYDERRYGWAEPAQGGTTP